MRIAFEVILVTGIFGGFFVKYITALPVPQHSVLARDLDTTKADKMYKSYASITNDRAESTSEVDVISRVQDVILATPTATVATNGKQHKTKKLYLVVKAMRQRNKRYINYLSLCHFKICNMGPKRTSRYFRITRRQQGDNEA